MTNSPKSDAFGLLSGSFPVDLHLLSINDWCRESLTSSSKATEFMCLAFLRFILLEAFKNDLLKRLSLLCMALLDLKCVDLV